MAKRSSEVAEKATKKQKVSKLTTESIKKDIGSINLDEIQTSKLSKLIENYDKLLLKFQEDEDGLERYEPVARYLNIELYKVFEHALKTEQLTIKNLEFQKVYQLFKFNLLFLIESIEEDCSLVIDNLDIYMKLMKLESTLLAPVNKLTKEIETHYFPAKTYKELVSAIIKSPNGETLKDGTHSNIVLQEFITNYYKKYSDLQFFFIIEFEHEAFSGETEFSKVLTILREQIIYNPETKTKTFISKLPQVFKNQSSFKKNFEKKWLFYLNLSLSIEQYKTILSILHKRIIPFFNNPVKLMDFLTDSYNLGGIVSILSLNGLFELIKSYNLDYPNFYEKLYSLFNKDLFHVKYRSRFLRLTDVFLNSTHLPTTIIASFIKRMARLSLTASPSAIVSVIPFIYNLLKKHPTCMVLLQNEEFDEFTDKFDNSVSNPLYTNAMESSLWELETLSSHYHPNVATLARIFKQPFRKLNYNMEDFLDWNYSILMETENSKNIKGEVALEFEHFDSLMGEYVDNWEW